MRAEPEIYVVRAASVGTRSRFLGAGDAGDPEKLAVALSRKLRALVPRGYGEMYPHLYGLQSALASRTFLAQLFVTMGAFALVLAAVGISGVLAYAVNRRLREFAVRVALGAQRADLVKAVLHDGLVMTLAGTGLGAFVALWTSFLLQNVLEDVYPTRRAHPGDRRSGSAGRNDRSMPVARLARREGRPDRDPAGDIAEHGEGCSLPGRTVPPSHTRCP